MRDIAALAAAAVLGIAGSAQANTPAGVYYERTVMTAANSRCGLFAPEVGAALAAAQAQSRGAALRAGAAEADLAQVRGRAETKAAAVGCASPDLKLAAGRVRSAFEGFSKIQRMTYPGDTAAWRADRVISAKGESWVLQQSAAFGPDRAIVGLAGQRGAHSQLTAAASFADHAVPYAARIVMRNTTRASRPYLAGKGLASRAPQASVARAFMAASRDGPASLAPSPDGAVVFRFPATAAQAIAGLDPREAVTVEFLFSGRGGDRVRRAFVEVGDFAAGQAFLNVARR